MSDTMTITVSASPLVLLLVLVLMLVSISVTHPVAYRVRLRQYDPSLCLWTMYFFDMMVIDCE